MFGERPRLISLLGGVLLVAALGFGYAHASSGSGSGHDQPDFSEFDDSDFDDSDFDDDFDDSDFDDSDFDDSDFDDNDFDNSGPGSEHSGRDRDWDDDRHERADHGRDGRDVVEAVYEIGLDSFGVEFIEDEVVLIGRQADISRARQLGFRVLSNRSLVSGGTIVRLSPPRGVRPRAAAESLAIAAPDAIVTVNTIYRSAQVGAARAGSRPIARNTPLVGAIGIIDTGVDVRKLPARNAILNHTAFAGRRPVAGEHGSLVAAIAVERGARVHVADVFGRGSDGRMAASAESIARALDWMIAHRVAVINISIEGPQNPLLQELVRRAAERGHIIVAAAGNGGPAAGPAFPAAFDQVLAVTAIDGRNQPYLRANRGDYIDFAALGVEVSVPSGERATTIVSGTSYAAPRIAAALGARLREPSVRGAADAITTLRQEAHDLGAPGRDPIFGWGAIQ